MSQTKVTDAVRDVTAVDGTKIDAVDGAKITTGTVDNARITLDAAEIPSLDASKITTGSIDAARVPAGAVTQHVQATDLTAVHQAIATLGLHTAVSDNKAAFNLPNAFIDTFEDDTGITTETDVDRDAAGEYISSAATSSTAVVWPYTNFSDQTFSSDGFSNITTHNSNSVTHEKARNNDASVYLALQNSPSGYSSAVKVDYKAVYTWTGVKVGFRNMWGMIKTWRLEYSDDGTNWSIMDQTGSTSANVSGYTVATDNNFSIATDATGVVTNVINGGNGDTHGGQITFGTAVTARHLKISVGSYVANSDSDSGLDFFQPLYLPLTTSATGTLISDTQTAPSATTEVSGVILYTDDAGTNTLGSSDDLAIYFTADNGSNWTEAASYGTPQTFSGTTKQVKLGKTTVTSGTQVAMKAVWANQAVTTPNTYATGDQTSNVTFTTNANIYNYSGSLADGLANIVDGVTNSNSSSHAFVFGTGTQTSSGKYLRFQFTSPQTVTEVKWHQANSTNTHGTFIWQGSNDVGGATGYVNIGATFTLGGIDGIQTITTLSGNSTAYTYYQMLGSAGSINDYPYIREIEFQRIAGVTGKVAQLNGWAVNY